MRNEFPIKKLALLLVGAAVLPELFDAIKLQYQMILNFFHMEDAGMVLVRGVKKQKKYAILSIGSIPHRICVVGKY